MKPHQSLKAAFGSIPNRLQLAGGWIDQPFVSRLNPRPPGAMVVVQIEHIEAVEKLFQAGVSFI